MSNGPGADVSSGSSVPCFQWLKKHRRAENKMNLPQFHEIAPRVAKARDVGPAGGGMQVVAVRPRGPVREICHVISGRARGLPRSSANGSAPRVEAVGSDRVPPRISSFLLLSGIRKPSSLLNATKHGLSK
ncbi:hypothetical protein NL676_017638 [Syzygium grande]|nr:hypothetical protein NL676_017638 [Syzygium grande]